MSAPPGHIMLANGLYWNPHEPDPDVIDLRVLALGMSRINRFAGQTTRALPVDEHCMRVRRIAVKIRSLHHAAVPKADLELAALLHDAHEPLTPWGDCPAPLKTDSMRTTEMWIDAAIRLALGIERPSAEILSIVKKADTIALYLEAMLWSPNAQDWAPGLLPKGSVLPPYLPLIWPEPGEDWWVQVEELLPLLSECSRRGPVGGA